MQNTCLCFKECCELWFDTMDVHALSLFDVCEITDPKIIEIEKRSCK